MKTLYKTMNGRKRENAGGDDSDRKHLTGREVGVWGAMEQ
jgi:hypothetical protein